MKLVTLVSAVLLFSGFQAQAQSPLLKPIAKGPLSGWTIVVDPGHGGIDPGCSWVFRKQKLYEASYTYPCTALLIDNLRRQGASVWPTIKSKKLQIAKASAQTVLSRPTDAVYTYDGSQVSGKTVALRCSAAERAWKVTPNHSKMMFIALHIDSRPPDQRGLWRGATVCFDARQEIAPLLAQRLASRLKAEKRACSFKGKLRYSDATTQRDLAVLRGNPITNRVLLEMGFPDYEHDSWLLRSPSGRKKITDLILQGILDVAQPSRIRALSKSHATIKKSNVKKAAKKTPAS